MRRSSALPSAIAVVVVLLGAFALVLEVLSGSHADPLWEDLLGVAVTLASVAIGLILALRRPEHPIGWLLLANAVLLSTIGVAAGYARYAVLEDPGALPGAEWAVLWDQSAWPLLYAVLLAIVLVFPDGKLPSPRWHRWAIGGAVAIALFMVLSFFDPEPFESPYVDVDRPLPALPDALAALWPVAFLGMLAGLVGGALSVRVRFRRARGIERLQLKWLAYSAVLVPLSLVICIVAVVLAEDGKDRGLFTALFLFMIGAFPVSIGIAVLRYRLYEIDRLINRTLVYGVLTVLLAAAYAATTLLLGATLGNGSAWTTAGATLAAAAAFRPLRARVQEAVDRRFSRARYDALRRTEAFLEELRAGTAAPEGVEPLLREVLADPELELRFWLPETAQYVDSHGQPSGDAKGDGRAAMQVARGGRPLGLVIHRPLDPGRPQLLEEVVEAAGLAIEIARLNVQLRRQLEEVATSRARIVTAGYEERRRIERNLHDGAQQRLLSIGLALRHAQHQLAPSANGTRDALDDAVREIALAIDELRELARGVRPAQLDGGLAPALRELAGRTPLAVEVNAGRERFPHDIEAAAYFVASEGLTNAVKHAGASTVWVAATRRGGLLVVSVRDDGAGGADSSGGSGLRGLRDRVEAHGGALRIDSHAGAGTTLIAELPCG
ncbi:MAG TPA: histidine kinase [Thermoleophilaceae bacterium]|nr:histidine kinase [Thermoleophilaceae bacterium]